MVGPCLSYMGVKAAWPTGRSAGKGYSGLAEGYSGVTNPTFAPTLLIEASNEGKLTLASVATVAIFLLKLVGLVSHRKASAKVY